MSDAVGPVSVLPRDGKQARPAVPSGLSDETRKLVDDEARRILDDCSGTASQVLADNRDKLDALAHALLEKESLEEEEAYAAARVEHAAAAVSSTAAA